MSEITPTVHLNGTTRESLLTQVLDAARAVEAARRQLGEAWPHGRDYYPQGDGALRAAEAQFGVWQKQLTEVYDGLHKLAGRIYAAGRG